MTDEPPDPMTPVGAVPQFVPPHLRGKVWDFRNEPDGNISFQHPEASIGLSKDRSRVSMTPDEYKLTFDQAHRMSNIEDAANTGYAPMQRIPKTSSRQWNEYIADKIRAAVGWGTSSQGKAVGTAGLLGAVAGGIGGYIWGSGQDKSPIRRALLLALLGGGLGAAGTAWAQSKHNRRESWLAKHAATDLTPLIIQMLADDQTLSYGQRALLMRAIINAEYSDQKDLYRLLRTAIGAGVGALATRFLVSKGLLPTIVGGILGGILGRGFGDNLSRNALGQVSITNYM